MPKKFTWWSIDAAFTKSAKYFTLISVLLIVIIMLWATIDAITTKFFNFPIPGTAEFIEDMNIPMVFLGIAFVTMEQGHISGPVFEQKFSQRVNRWIRFAGYFLGFLFCALVAWRQIPLVDRYFTTQLSKGGKVDFVIWPFALSILIGFILAAVSFIFVMVRVLAGKEEVPGKDKTQNAEKIEAASIEELHIV